MFMVAKPIYDYTTGKQRRNIEAERIARGRVWNILLGETY
jgi:hypothetical protein